VADGTKNNGRITLGMTVIAAIMLIGIILIGFGHFENSTIAFYVGLLMTLAGILMGIIRTVIHRKT